MKILTIERVKLMHEEFERNFSDTTVELITHILESVRINEGHQQAEKEAKEIRELIESEINEADLLTRLTTKKRTPPTKEGRSAILIIRSLKRKQLKECTVQKILSIILETRKNFGMQASEQMATVLIPIVDASENDEELLENITHIEVEGTYF